MSQADLFGQRPKLHPHAHTCHWPGCRMVVDPKMWGCRRHWLLLPPLFRAAIWRAYQPGQEIRKNPSPEYVKAARAAEKWAMAYEKAERDLLKKEGYCEKPL